LLEHKLNEGKKEEKEEKKTHHNFSLEIFKVFHKKMGGMIEYL